MISPNHDKIRDAVRAVVPAARWLSTEPVLYDGGAVHLSAPSALDAAGVLIDDNDALYDSEELLELLTDEPVVATDGQVLDLDDPTAAWVPTP